MLLNDPEVFYRNQETRVLNLFRPSNDIECAVRVEAEEHLRAKYSPGEYRDCDKVNDILKYQFNFYYERLKTLIPKIASRSVIRKLLKNYDATVLSNYFVKNGECSENDRQQGSDSDFYISGGFKHLCELVVCAEPQSEQCICSDDPADFAKCVVYCEELVKLSYLSSQTYMLFPEKTVLKIVPQCIAAELDLLYLVIDGFDSKGYSRFQESCTTDNLKHLKYFGNKDLRFDIKEVKSKLDPAFSGCLGFSISNAMEWAIDLMHRADTCSTIQKEVEYLKENQKINEEAARLLIAGLTLSATKMKEQEKKDKNGNIRIGRVIWDAKQHYQAHARPFFSFRKGTDDILIWSRGMAKECICVGFFKNLSHQNLPAEWGNQTTKAALLKYNQSKAQEFEKLTIEKIEDRGLFAGGFKDKIDCVNIPDEVGEIDCLIALPDGETIVVGECKFIKSAANPQTFRDDISTFFKDSNCYCEQVLKKATWVHDNLQSISEALTMLHPSKQKQNFKRVVPMLITYTPTIASYFLHENNFGHVSCKSLTELLDAIDGQTLNFPCIQ